MMMNTPSAQMNKPMRSSSQRAAVCQRAPLSHRSGGGGTSPRLPLLQQQRPFLGATTAPITTTTTLRPTIAHAETYSRDLSAAPRLIQHKNEAKFFYMFLSQVYDYIVNPGHWTIDMRTEALKPAKLDSSELKVVDVGGGTGFCTQGIVQTVDPHNVTLLDQSPHQLAKARNKADLQGVTIVEGDAEDLPFETDSADRYVSAGSIEYWPEPQRGICEAYRVIKPGGLACLIGPVHPTYPLSRAMADIWMLFPTEQEYIEWFTAAGFEDVTVHRIGPKWYRGVRRHGLIMGCSVTGTKKVAGASPLNLGVKAERSENMNTNPLAFLLRVVLGSTAGFYYFVLPVYMWFKNLIWPKTGPLADKF